MIEGLDRIAAMENHTKQFGALIESLTRVINDQHPTPAVVLDVLANLHVLLAIQCNVPRGMVHANVDTLFDANDPGKIVIPGQQLVHTNGGIIS